ncbi:signal peptidase II [Candidatus Woesearchaeota archaeon]|nr:signal peptidase II [Candidatus Woesearchaeota archaeon]
MVSHYFSRFAFGAITVTTVLADQLTKFLVSQVQPRWNLKLFDIHLVTNTGAGFGLFQDNAVLLGVVSLAVAVGLILNYQKIPKQPSLQILVSLFLGGVLGNLIDRFFRGYVIDFIDLRFWPAFNVADAAISVAVVGLLWQAWNDESSKRKTSHHETPPKHRP